MNIKALTPQPVTVIDTKSKVESKARAQSSTDRDADGRQSEKDQEQKRHLTPQEFDDCLKILEGMPGLKSNNLKVNIESEDGIRVLLILAPDGKVVRRLSEAQLWSATRDKDRQTGKILDKAM